MILTKRVEASLLKISNFFVLIIALSLLVISFFMFIEFLINFPHIFLVEKHLFLENTEAAVKSLKEIISSLLMFVVVVEVIFMLLKHQPRIVFDVLLIAVAREIIIAGADFRDVLLGTFSLLVLFLIRKFLIVKGLPPGTSIIVDPYISIEALNEMLDVHVPFEVERYLVDIIERLSRERRLKIKKGRTIDIANIKVEILDVDETGKPVLVRVIKTA
jgi:hypothetical protein